MNPTNIHLAYGRSREKYFGTVEVDKGEPFHFDGWDFDQMMWRLAHTIQEYPTVEVILSRLEAKNSNYRLDAETVDLLRKNPEAAIATMSHPNRTIIVRDDQKTTQRLLRAGHDTLAEAFGERLYCRVKDGLVECPCCGRWRGVMRGTNVECRSCHAKVQGELHGSKWFSVGVEDLLTQQRTKYFLPREWNTNGSWVSHEALRLRYETFNQERQAWH